MKQIKPLQIWAAGQTKTAAVLDARIVEDDLRSRCVFYWTLKEADKVEEAEEGKDAVTIPGQLVADGNAAMAGENYLGWDGSNDEAFSFIAKQINVELLP